MTITANHADSFASQTAQPIKLPGKVKLEFGALADGDEQMAVQYDVAPGSSIKFRVNGALVPTVSVCDVAGATNVDACGGGYNVRVPYTRHVVFDALLDRDPAAGPPPQLTVTITMSASQGGKIRFSAPLTVAVV